VSNAQHAENSPLRIPAEEDLSPAWFLSVGMRLLQNCENVPQPRQQEIVALGEVRPSVSQGRFHPGAAFLSSDVIMVGSI